MLTMQVHQGGAQLAEVGQGGQPRVDAAGAAPRGVQVAAQEQLVVGLLQSPLVDQGAGFFRRVRKRPLTNLSAPERSLSRGVLPTGNRASDQDFPTRLPEDVEALREGGKPVPQGEVDDF